MKKQLFTLSLFLMSLGLFSQSTVWQPHNITIDTTWYPRWLSAVDTNSVWGVPFNGARIYATSNRFTRTQDGLNFTSGTFLPDTAYYTPSNISAVNDSVAYIPCFFKAGTGRSGIVRKTMDRGLTWTTCTDTTTMFLGVNNFPNWAHFYTNNFGIVMGDPNGGNFEIYHTHNGGTNWTRVPSANIPVPVGEYGVTDKFTWYGNKHIWFGTNHGGTNGVPHVYCSSDTGHTWQAYQVPGMLAGVFGLAFRDSLNGMCWGYASTASTKLMIMKTQNGGVTWTTVIQHNKVGLNDISVVPGRNAYLSVGIDSLALNPNAYITSVTYDDGNTWTILDQGSTNPFRMIQMTMLDSAHGWAGCLSDNTLPKGLNGMDSWKGPVIALGCPVGIYGATSICAGTPTILMANGATNYTWTPMGVNTATVSVSPTSQTIYTVTGSAGTCSNTVTYTLATTPNPTVTITTTVTTVCSGKPTQISATGATTYTWNPGGLTTGTATVSPVNNTTYTVTGSTGGCVDTKTLTLTTTPNPTVTASASSATICAANSTTLTANGASSYTWNPGGSNSSTVTVSPSTSQVYTVTGISSGCSDTKTVSIAVTPTPTVAITSTVSTVCSGQSTTISAGGATSYTWNPGALSAASVTVSPSSTTVYTVSGSTSGCVGNSATVTITPAATPTLVITSSTYTICNLNSATINGSGATTYTWNPGAIHTGTVTVSPSTTTVYTVSGTTGACTGTSTVTITVLPCIGIDQLSASNTQVSFYPNPSNGTIEVVLENVKAGTVLNIFDMIGNEVYKTTFNSNSINQNLSIDLSSLPKGIYLFGVSNGNQKRVQKLIIQ